MDDGLLSYVVVELDDTDIVAIWGPFPTIEEASAWDGIPNTGNTHYSVKILRSAPRWSEVAD